MYEVAVSMAASSRTHSIAEPLDLYRAGNVTACLRALHEETSAEAISLRVRTLIRLNRPAEALAHVSELPYDTIDDEAIALALRIQCSAMLEDWRAVDRDVASAKSRFCVASNEAKSELAYGRAFASFCRGDAIGMAEAFVGVFPGTSPYSAARLLYMRGWLASMRAQYVEHVRLMERAARLFSAPDAYDAWLLADCAQALTHAVREIFTANTYEFVTDLVRGLPWTDDLKTKRFLCTRALAWAHALRGFHRVAQQLMYASRDSAPSQRWVVACYADQAYLARMAGGRLTADALMEHAIALAHRAEWETPGEDRVALLALIELAADTDLASARSLLAIYASIRTMIAPSLALGRDRRLEAMESYTRGVVLAAAGEQAEAQAYLERSYASFAAIGYAWRAAAAALRLHSLRKDGRWLKRAEQAVRDFPESSVACEIRRQANGTADPRYAALTKAQRRALHLVCKGLSDRAIAEEMGVSVNTAKNHVAAVRARFSARSRAQVVAFAREAGLCPDSPTGE